METPNLSAIQPGDEITVRVRVTSTLPGDIPLFNIGGPVGNRLLGPGPHWLTAEHVVAHHPEAS